jgi:hypothetical protein
MNAATTMALSNVIASNCTAASGACLVLCHVCQALLISVIGMCGEVAWIGAGIA